MKPPRVNQPPQALKTDPAIAAQPGVARSFWRRRLIDPLIGQLKQGATPEKLAQSMAWGSLIGVFPILGTTTALCGVAGVAFKLNHIAIQTMNWLVYPLQIALILPFLQLGNLIVGQPPLTLSIEEISAMFAEDFLTAARNLGGLALRGIAAWLVVALPASWLITKILVYPLRSLAGKIPSGNNKP